MKPILSAFICVKGIELTKQEADLLHRYNPAGLTLFRRNIDSPEQVKKLTDDIRSAVNRSDFLIAADQEGGNVRRFRPPNWHEYVSQKQLGSLPEAQAKEAIKLHSSLIAYDLHQLGVNVVFSPVADILHENTTEIIASRCFSKDSKIVVEYASLLAKNYMDLGICPCMKHLPGHGLATTDSHLGLPVIDKDFSEIERDFLPFQKLSKFIPMGMTAHVVLPMIDDKPVTQSRKGIDLIRKEIGFNGLLITDTIEMKALKGSLTERAKQSLQAGCDVVCYCSGHDQNNPTMLEENEEVLKACSPLSDFSLERLSQVLKIVNKNYIMGNIQDQIKRYDALTTIRTTSNSSDGTENWASNCIKKTL